MTAMNIKVGQVWKHVDNNQQYLVVGISDNLFILKDHGVKGYVHSPFDLQKHLQHYQLISEWDGAVRTGQRWEYLTIDNEWVPLIIHEGDILLRSKLKDHINNPIPHYRYIGEAENKQFPEEITVYASKQDKGKSKLDVDDGFYTGQKWKYLPNSTICTVKSIDASSLTIIQENNNFTWVEIKHKFFDPHRWQPVLTPYAGMRFVHLGKVYCVVSKRWEIVTARRENDMCEIMITWTDSDDKSPIIPQQFDGGNLIDAQMYSAQAKAGFIKKKENVEMKRLKFAEVELVRVAHVTIRAKMNELASVLNHDATEIDGKVYFRMPDKLVGEFEVSPAELDKLLRTKILEGDQTVIDFAISSGILVRGTFVVK